MARTKRESKVLQKAEMRLAALQSISPKLDLGGGVTVASFGQAVTRLANAQADYNKQQAQSDGARARLKEQEQVVADLTERVLSGVAAHFGRNSVEYGQAGGKRKTDRAKRGKGRVALRTARAKAAAGGAKTPAKGTGLVFQLNPQEPVHAPATNEQAGSQVNGKSKQGEEVHT